MCGIAGILAFTPHAEIITSDLIERMRDTLVHRGPDEAGVFRDEYIALGQRRLSIIDLAGGLQPMSNAEESIWVLNNGEIYNYQSLRQNLEAQGYPFRTQSDTEVIIQGYCAYGDKVISHLRGMFAAVIWDVQHKRLILARDRVGKKPIYYAHLPEGLFFASELKALLQYAGLPRELDQNALADYFIYQSIPDPLTIFKSIRKLPPAHILTCDLTGKVEISRYWEWSLYKNQPTNLPYDEAVARVRELIDESTRLRMISDVPLGALLSGGVDSSAIVAMMSRHAAGRVKTFSIGFTHADYDESPFAREVADFCGTEHHELIVEPEAIHSILPRLARQYDEPFADSSALPTYYVCKMARQQVTVALAGDGGDEAFAGYDRYAKFLQLSQQWDKVPLARAVAEGITRFLPLGLQGQRTLRLIGTPLPARYARMTSIFEPANLHRLLQGQNGQPRPLLEQDFRLTQTAGLPLLAQLQTADMAVYLPSTVLVKVDRASMLNSLEVRAPLLDHELLDFVGTLPVEWQLGKRVLKDAIRGLVPERVLTRPKAGFAVPLEHWFKGQFGAFLREILLDTQTKQRGILNTAYVDKLITRAEQPWANLTMHLWSVLMFELWCREYL